MQNLDVISVNFWNILVSLLNLLLIFLLVKKFLFAPVRKVLAARQKTIDGAYDDANRAKSEAEADRAAWGEKLNAADEEAARILKESSERADRRGEQIVAEAKSRADSILREAETEAALEKKKAQSEIKQEIVDVSALLTEKMLRREIQTEDHRALIDSVLAEIGEDHDGNQ